MALTALVLVLGVVLLIGWATGPSLSEGDAQKYFDQAARGKVQILGCDRTTVLYEPAWACAATTSDPGVFRRLQLTERRRIALALVCFRESRDPLELGLGYPDPGSSGTAEEPCGPAES
jgi:hypothetical protein